MNPEHLPPARTGPDDDHPAGSARRGEAAAAGGEAARLAPIAYFRVVALDVDGTLVSGDRLAEGTLAALRSARSRGMCVVLVTGRTLRDLDATFPGLRGEVDAVVGENGAVVATPVGERPLAAPVEPALGEALSAAGVAWSAGDVLLACSGEDEEAVLDAVRRLGYEYDLVRNRAALMVLPAGVTKGTGLAEALADLGFSGHNAIGVGDAENDHTLLDSCELGVAVGNAVPALRQHADVVLEGSDGVGVTELLSGGILWGTRRVHPRRWNLLLGVTDAGRVVTLPASQLNVIVAGGTGDGKSYLAGMMAEQLVRLGYTVAVLDPEGDHVGLDRLHEVVVIDAARYREADDLVALLVRHDRSVVVDLSGLEPAAQDGLLARLPVEIQVQRAARGVPQWVLLDEAHRGAGAREAAFSALDPAARGLLLVTWRPQDLSADIVASADAVIGLSSPCPADGLVDLVAGVAGVARTHAARRLQGPAGRAVAAWRDRPGCLEVFSPTRRATSHLRHEHKYGDGGMDAVRRFFFRQVPDVAAGVTAGSVADLEAVLAGCHRGVLLHHCPRGDLSRWIAEVIHDQALAERVAAVEAGVGATSPAAVVEAARVELIAALRARM